MHYKVLCKLAWVYRLPKSISFLSVAIAALSIFGIFWNILEASGVSGSPSLSIGLLLGIMFLLSSGVFFAHFMHWTLLFLAIRSYVDRHLKQTLSRKDLVLLGIGPGGALSVGMVAKALRSLHIEPPSCLVLDMRYKKKGEDPLIGETYPGELKVSKDNCFLIHGNVNTGRSLRCFRNKYGLEECPIFAFVVSEGASKTENITYTMMVGDRSILPWKTEAVPE